MTPHSVLVWLRRLVAFTGLLLVSVTGPLWLPPAEFPHVPLAAWVMNFPPQGDSLFLAVMTAALVAMLLPPWPTLRRDSPDVSSTVKGEPLAPPTGRRTLPPLIFVAAATLLVLWNQHRLQPWLYQFGLIAVVLTAATPRRGLTLLRLFTISIYLHSAASKLDYSFLHTHGQYLAGGLVGPFGGTLETWPESSRIAAAAALPTAELLIALGLCLRWSRRYAAWAAAVMHAALLVALGPWSLDHHAGVLMWNVFFLLQTLLLFGFVEPPAPAGRDGATPDGGDPRVGARAGDRVAGLVIAMAVLLPCLEPWGYFDHWPSWALYSSRPERVRISVHAEDRQRLPASLQQHIHEQPLSDWLPVRIDRWSLASVGAPISPEGRFQLGVALWIAECGERPPRIRVRWESEADRWNGQRSARTVRSAQEIHTLLSAFRLNGVPRCTRH